MKNYFSRLGTIFTVALAIMQLGCASSERKVAKTIDFTPDIIQQGSDLLAADPELSRFSIEVDGFKCDMRLKGQVASEAQRARAEKIIWAVKGVRSVDNRLKVAALPNQDKKADLILPFRRTEAK